MSKSNSFETDILELILNNTDLAGVGDASGLQGSATAGSLYIALHTADPTETGSMAAEATYTSYARIAVARSAGGWTVSGATASNAAIITFDKCTGLTNTITHFSVCKGATEGVADIIYSGALDSSLAVSNNIVPAFAIGDLTITED